MVVAMVMIMTVVAGMIMCMIVAQGFERRGSGAFRGGVPGAHSVDGLVQCVAGSRVNLLLALHRRHHYGVEALQLSEIGGGAGLARWNRFHAFHRRRRF